MVLDLRSQAEHTDRLQVAGSFCEWKVSLSSSVHPVSREQEGKTASAQSIRAGRLLRVRGRGSGRTAHPARAALR